MICSSTFPVISYGVGLVGSFVYIRMLGSSVDSLADGAKGLVKCVLYHFFLMDIAHLNKLCIYIYC